MKSKKGLSMVVVAVLLIALTITLVAILGTSTRDLVEKDLSKAESCFGIFEKMTFNDEYTCYNSTSETMQFSLERKDFEMDELLISISFGDNSRTFRIYEDDSEVYGVYPYNGALGDSVSLPPKEGGKTYFVNETSEMPIKIQIAPVVNGNQCDVSDTVTTFVLCI